MALAEAVDIALCANPQVQSTWAAIKVQAAALGEARATYWPTVAAGLSRVNDRTTFPGSKLQPTAVRDNSKNIGVSWRLFDFGGRAANNRSATDLLNAALASHDATLQKTLETLIGAYFDAQTTLAAWQAKLTSEELARSTVETAQRKESRGAGAQSDTLQATTAFARASLDRSRAQGDYRKAMSMLIYVLGIPAETQLQLAPDLADDSHDMGKDLDTWLAQAKDQHPAIVAGRAQVEAAREKVKVIRSEGLPSIDATGNMYKNGRPNQGLPSVNTTEKVAALTLNIPIFDGFANKYKVSGAQAQVEQQQANLLDTTHQVQMDVVKAHADAQSALGNLESSQLLLQSAQNALASVQRKFDRGASDILEILSTQAALADAHQQRIRCLAEWRSARLRLLAASGGLGHRDISVSQ
ncbi:TolC family protein [Collimonas sp.]|uniref:TolC family protein n=1 Tax=Collimonas sp. TaxID=1963772 RepID=UPI002BEF6F48|nr:TolC family protein [Collimonas sp.]HWW04233.1 TolC family protein [Collimonas sp.]